MLFVEKNLKEINWANQKQKQEEHWDVSGILYKKTNQTYKYDLSPVKKFNDGSVGKNGKFNSKADKMLFEFKDNWIIVDVEELNKYVKDNNKKDILLEEILEKLDWNIILNKNE